MKRNILLAILVTVAGATAVLAGGPAAAADVECRYAPQPVTGEDPIPLPPPPPGPQPNQVLYVSGITRTTPYRVSYPVQRSAWSVVGIRSAPGTDYNLAVRDCDFNRRVISSLAGVPVDFVALDGDQPLPDRISATVSNATDRVAAFAIEYSTDGPALTAGTPQTLMVRGTPAIVRDLYVPGGSTVVVSLRPLSGDADLAVVSSTSDSWMVARAQAGYASTQPGLAEDRVAISVPFGVAGRTFGVVVVNNAPLTEAVLSLHQPS